MEVKVKALQSFVHGRIAMVKGQVGPISQADAQDLKRAGIVDVAAEPVQAEKAQVEKTGVGSRGPRRKASDGKTPAGEGTTPGIDTKPAGGEGSTDNGAGGDSPTDDKVGQTDKLNDLAPEGLGEEQ